MSKAKIIQFKQPKNPKQNFTKSDMQVFDAKQFASAFTQTR